LVHSSALQVLWRSTLALVIYTSFMFAHAAAAADTTSPPEHVSIGRTIANDYDTFYSHDRLIRLGIAFGLGGIAANTNIDMSIRNWYQDKVRNDQTNSWASSTATDHGFYAKTFGEGKYMVPVALLAASVNLMDTDTAVGNWGANASRAYIVGLPAMWAMQWTTGAARPGEADTGSAWRPLNIQDGHGVSGHAFVGAVPFLTVAYMNSDNAWIKYSAYLASAAAGWSRINDDAHFPSQVFLGWYMAYEAVDTVFENNSKRKGLVVTPMAGIDGFGLMAHTSW
jgi:membrane-associated phospholipid phosphatase